MLFNSWGYIVIFLIVAVAMHWSLPHRFRLGVLAAFSLLFYSMWRWEFSLLVLFSAVVDFVCAKRIHATERPAARRGWLLVSLVINLGLLVFFKYTYFIYDNVRFVGEVAGWNIPSLSSLGIRIILPLGISFYTFQTISYTIDVYRRVTEPEEHFIPFLTYVTFWPQLIAGPILRATEVIPQLKERRILQMEDMGEGLFIVVAGLFKKVVIADTIGPMVDTAFGFDPATMTALDVWVATFLFGFQIYYDFSGYSDIAVGSARMLGMRFPWNFNYPYIALSPRDFWNRWHISLSAWIRDYLYLPLTGQAFRTKSTGGIAVAGDASQANKTRALFLTWLIMGFWHGAGWTFAIWGLYHACAIYLYRKIGFLGMLAKRSTVAAWGLMLLISMAGWIPFRAATVGASLQMFGRILNPLAYTISSRKVPGDAYLAAAVLLLGMLAVYALEWTSRRWPLPSVLAAPATTFVVGAMVCAIIPMMRTVKQFIYFQF